MIESIYAKHSAKMVICDNCGDGFEAESWNEAKINMKDNNWIIKRIDGKYRHYCEMCKLAGA